MYKKVFLKMPILKTPQPELNFFSGLYKPPQEPLFEEQAALLAMIKRLRWKYIILIVEHLQPFVTEAFSDATAKEDICITLNINVNTNK